MTTLQTGPPRVWGYARVSTDEQFRSRLSIDEQHDQIRRFCQKEGLDLGRGDCRLGEESASAYELRFADRPLGKRLHEELQPGDHLVIAKLDRAFRDMEDALSMVGQWQARKIHLHILDIPTGGAPIFDRLILGLLSWVAEFESHRKSERMADAWRSAKRSGRPMGQQNAPWGFRWVGTKVRSTQRLVYCSEEREIMALCYSLWSEHQFGFPEIASYLIRNRVQPGDRRPSWRQTKKGAQAEVFHIRYLRDMVRQEAYFRYYEAKGLSPEEGAFQWLADVRGGSLPAQEEIQEQFNATFHTKGTVCPTT